MIYVASAKRLGLVVGVVGGENTHECLAGYDQTCTRRNADDLLRFYEIKGL